MGFCRQPRAFLPPEMKKREGEGLRGLFCFAWMTPPGDSPVAQSRALRRDRKHAEVVRSNVMAVLQLRACSLESHLLGSKSDGPCEFG